MNNKASKSEDSHRDNILREQVRLVMRQIPTMQWTSFVVALVLSYVVSSTVPPASILAWIIMVLAIVIARIALYNRFGKVREVHFAGELWKKLYLILAFISGIIWGSSAILIFPSGNPGLISLFVLVIASLAAATTISHSSIKLAPAAWSGPALLFYAVRCLMERSELGYTVAFLIILYLYTILRHSFTHHGAITSAISLRFENVELVEELQKVNDLLRRDIFERRQAEEAIMRAKEEWEITFDSVPELIAILDDQNRIIRINKAMADRLRIPREEMNGSGLRCYEIIHGTPAPIEGCPHMRSLADGRVHTAEVSLDRLHGDFSITVSPLHDTQGRLIGSVHVARDITLSKRVERALKVSNTFLTLSNRHEELPRLIEEIAKAVKSVTRCGAVAIRVLGDNGQSVCEARHGFREPLPAVDDWLARLWDRSTTRSHGEGVGGTAAPAVAHVRSFFHNDAGTVVSANSTGSGSASDRDKISTLPYESIARVPIGPPEYPLGFVYAADARKAVFSQELVELLENAAMQMGTAIQKLLAQESLKLAHQELEKRVEERTHALSTANTLLRSEILERKRIEEDMRRESAFREAVIANAREGLCVWYLIDEHPHVQFSVWNHSMEEITGYSMEEINRLGWIATMYEDPETQSQVMEAMKNVGKEKRFTRLERTIRRADGKTRTVVISSSPIQFQENREHVIALLQDVTELKEAEYALRQSETQFRGLVEGIRVGLLILRDGIILYQNPEQERLLGGWLTVPYPLESLVEAVHVDDRPAFEALCKTLHSQDAASIETVVRLVSPGGGAARGARWASCRCTSIEYQGKDANFIHMMDITELKDLERLVMQREKMASLGHVAAGIAHEIRNPLSGINVYLDAIRDCYRDPECVEDVATLVQEAQATSNKIESVIRRVLDFSRPTELRMRPTSINETIREAVKLAAVALRKASIHLELALDDGLALVFADAQLIEQLMINLINNAADVLKACQGERRIRISTRMKDGYVLIQVEDSGPGVPEEVRERVFEPFFTTRSRGMGIGLGICKRIISDHKGDIFILTSPMGGAQFNILVPVEKRRQNR